MYVVTTHTQVTTNTSLHLVEKTCCWAVRFRLVPRYFGTSKPEQTVVWYHLWPPTGRGANQASTMGRRKESEAFPPKAKRSVSKNIGRARGGRPAGFRQQGIHIRDDSCHTLRLEADP